MAVAELPTDYSLQEYRVESTLGTGGFGLTYLATDSNLNLKVAIKEYLPYEFAVRGEDMTVRPKSGNDADSFKWGLDRFMDEARTLASFRHPNIVRVMRFFQANQTAYMVMEFVAGRSLPDWAPSRRPFDEASVRALLMPILDGLTVVHGAGFLHRDIKPGNIFMREDGSPVLLDFGSARQADRREHTAIVSPGYAPLEQYFPDGRQGPWSDIYALGGVLYWLITGNKPPDALARLRNDPMPPALSAGAGRYSVDLLTAIDWMLTPGDEARPQSVADLLPGLQGAGTNPPRPVERTVRTTPPPAPPQPAAPAVAALDPERLKKIEAELTRHIGPIAAVVMRTAVKKSASMLQLVETVAREIDDESERARFLKRFSENSVPRPPEPSSGNPKTAMAEKRFEGAILDKAESALAKHLGPLARVVVKRAAMKARDEAELYLLIADEIEDREERKAFIRKAVANRA